MHGKNWKKVAIENSKLKLLKLCLETIMHSAIVLRFFLQHLTLETWSLWISRLCVTRFSDLDGSVSICPNVLCAFLVNSTSVYVPCGLLLGKGWPLGSRMWCLLWVCHFPIGILGQEWYLIESIPDLCTLTYLDWGIGIHSAKMSACGGGGLLYHYSIQCLHE